MRMMVGGTEAVVFYREYLSLGPKTTAQARRVRSVPARMKNALRRLTGTIHTDHFMMNKAQYYCIKC